VLDLKGSRASREYIDAASLMVQPILTDKLWWSVTVNVQDIPLSKL
jgi:hypothetical protein